MRLSHSLQTPFPLARLLISGRSPSLVRGLVMIGLGGALPPLCAQTTFLGSWENLVPAQYGKPYTTKTDPTSNPNLGVFKFYPAYWTPSGFPLTFDDYVEQEWLVADILAQPRTEILSDNRWSNPNAWSDNLPSVTKGARIVDSQTLVLPLLNEAAATARSLQVFDATSSNAQAVVIKDGTLNLTPNSVFETAFTVGIASTQPGTSRSTTLTLNNAILSSSAFAAIGQGLSAGVGGPLLATLILENGAKWFHPAGLIELGGGDGIGKLTIDTGSVLAGSLLAGTATDPSLKIASASAATILGSVRLSEVDVNSKSGSLNGRGLEILGDATLQLLRVGSSAEAYVWLSAGGTADFGGVSIMRDSNVKIYGTASASSVDLDSGYVEVGNLGSLTLGSAAANTNATLFRIARDSASAATLNIGRNHYSSPMPGGDIVVHGAAQLGGYGEATINVVQGGLLDIRGDATVGRTSTYRDSDANGNAVVTVIGSGSTLRVQNIAIGHEQDSFRSIVGTVGRIDVGGGGRVEVAGSTVTASSFNPFTGTLVSFTYNYGGALTVGRYGLLDLVELLNGTGKVLFTDPSAGAILSTPASLTNYGTITGGDSTGGAPPAGGQIDFGDRGGTLTNRGTIAPGHSAGWLTINGDLTLQSTSNLLLELGGTTRGSGYDALTVTGALSAGGTLTVSLINGFSPTSGASFDLFDFGSLTGTFTTVNLPIGYDWNTDALYTTGVISLGAVPEPSTYALGAGLGALGVALVRRRRRTRSQRADRQAPATTSP